MPPARSALQARVRLRVRIKLRVRAWARVRGRARGSFSALEPTGVSGMRLPDCFYQGTKGYKEASYDVSGGVEFGFMSASMCKPRATWPAHAAHGPRLAGALSSRRRAPAPREASGAPGRGVSRLTLISARSPHRSASASKEESMKYAEVRVK